MASSASAPEKTRASRVSGNCHKGCASTWRSARASRSRRADSSERKASIRPRSFVARFSSPSSASRSGLIWAARASKAGAIAPSRLRTSTGACRCPAQSTRWRQAAASSAARSRSSSSAAALPSSAVALDNSPSEYRMSVSRSRSSTTVASSGEISDSRPPEAWKAFSASATVSARPGLACSSARRRRISVRKASAASAALRLSATGGTAGAGGFAAAATASARAAVGGGGNAAGSPPAQAIPASGSSTAAAPARRAAHPAAASLMNLENVAGRKAVTQGWRMLRRRAFPAAVARRVTGFCRVSAEGRLGCQ